MTTELIARLPPDSLGGARVFRPCNVGGIQRKSGEVLSAEDVASLSKPALRALMDQRFIVAWPKAPDAASPDPDAELLVYNRIGTSTYDVVRGTLLNDKPLSKADAEALAAKHRRPEAA